jgi:hypothetical protein
MGLVVIDEVDAARLGAGKEEAPVVPTVCDLCGREPAGETLLLKQTLTTEAQRPITYWRCTPCGDARRELVIARKLA